MNDITRRFFSGDTLEQALMQAARHFEVEPDELAYRQIEKKHGFVKMRRRFVIEVSPEAPRRETAPAERPAAAGPPAGPPAAPSPAAPPRPEPPREECARREDERATRARDDEEAPEIAAAPRIPGPPLRISERIDPKTVVEAPDQGEEADGSDGFEGAEGAGQPAAARPAPRKRRSLVELPDAPRRAIDLFEPATGAQADAAREGLRRLFALGSLELEAEVLQGEDRFEVEIWGADQEELLRDRGRLLLGIQHLLPRLIRGVTGESSPCRVDCENFHEIRAERLRDLAQRAASEVGRSGRQRTLEPMSPDERRIVHLTLADDPTVETESKGEGLFKRVMVRPTSRRPRGFEPFNR